MVETFSRGEFFIVDCDFFLWRWGGGGEADKMAAKLYSNPH